MLCLVSGGREAERVCCLALVCAVPLHLNCMMQQSPIAAREERVENGGPLGKEDVNNKDIETVEAELSNARQRGTADPFALYLYGLVLIDK